MPTDGTDVKVGGGVCEERSSLSWAGSLVAKVPLLAALSGVTLLVFFHSGLHGGSRLRTRRGTEVPCS